MKARLIPLYFESLRNNDFDARLGDLHRLLDDKAEFLEPQELGAPMPDADAVVFPQLLGEAYRAVDKFRAIDLPILVVTSEFATMSMWDWEILDYLKTEGIDAIAPYSLDQARRTCDALCAKRALRGGRFLVFQEDPGEGAQAGIFKRFYWWEDQCIRRMLDKFGVAVEKKSFRQLGVEARNIPDEQAVATAKRLSIPVEDVPRGSLNSAIKLYLAVKQHLKDDDTVRAVGINCLNESHFSDTTPCLAWNLLFQERRMVWGCEADIMSMLTHFILYRSLDVPIMMTNLYPFLMGDAALKHERIEGFPEVDDAPEDHVLVAHCGYMGVIPQDFATEWTLRKKVLAMVDDNATAIDARLPTGDVTLAKLNASMDKITIAEGVLEFYTGFPNSDCLNGGVIRITDGHRFIASLTSHHTLLMTGHHLPDMRNIARVFGLDFEEI